MAGTNKGRKGKLGKNKSRIAAYYGNARWEWNKLRRLVKHFRRYGDNDASANKSFENLKAALPLRAYREFEAQYM